MRGPVPREELRLPLCLAFGALLHAMQPKQAICLEALGHPRPFRDSAGGQLHREPERLLLQGLCFARLEPLAVAWDQAYRHVFQAAYVRVASALEEQAAGKAVHDLQARLSYVFAVALPGLGFDRPWATLTAAEVART